MNVLNKLFLNGYSSREGKMSFFGSLKQNRTIRLSEGAELRMENI